MNLTGRPPYQKGSAKKKSKAATPAQRRRWEALRSMGCILTFMGVAHACQGRITIHHCGTGGGGRKNHDQVVPLCAAMHTGPEGIDGRGMSKNAWQEHYATEAAMLYFVQEIERGVDGVPHE